MKKYRVIPLLMALIALDLYGSGAICPTPLPAKYRSLQHGTICAAYVGGWDVHGTHNKYPIEKIAEIADQLTHIIYAFVLPDAESGKCVLQDPWSEVGAIDSKKSILAGNFLQLQKLKKDFPHLKVLLSVGGGKSNKDLLSIAQDRQKLDAFAESCVAILDGYDYEYKDPFSEKIKITHFDYSGLFDGLDIDWEWDAGTLTQKLSQEFTHFIKKIKILLAGRKKNYEYSSLLTIDLQVIPSVYQTLDLQALAKNVDWFNIMAYDFFGPWNKNVGFNAPICGSSSVYSIDGAVQRIMEQGVSPAKMVLGVPLYGYIYEQSLGLNSVIDKSKANSRALSYHIIKSRYLDSKLFKKEWHDKADVPSLYSKSDKTFVSYDDTDSVKRKVGFVKNKKMQGLVVWRLSGDDEQYSIINTISKSLHKK